MKRTAYDDTDREDWEGDLESDERFVRLHLDWLQEGKEPVEMLEGLLFRAFNAFGVLSILEPTGAKIRWCVDLLASTCLGRAMPWVIDSPTPVTVMDASFVLRPNPDAEVGGNHFWLDGLLFTWISRGDDAPLAQMPEARLAGANGIFACFHSAASACRAFIARDVEELDRALEAFERYEWDIPVDHWSVEEASARLCFVRCLKPLLEGDEETFDKVFKACLTEHAAFYGNEDNFGEERAYVAVGLVAVATKAHDAGLSIPVESGYLPRLWE